jgi:hypothetical protein
MGSLHEWVPSTSKKPTISVQDTTPSQNIWSRNKIWGAHLWPKINTFLWLVTHQSILTWDNLTKRGLIGPSLCPLCCNEGETQNHLLNLCPFSSQIWDQCAIIMRASTETTTASGKPLRDGETQSFTLPSSIVCGNFFLDSFYGSCGKRGIVVSSNPLSSDGKQSGPKFILTSRKQSTYTPGLIQHDLPSSRADHP